MLSRDRKLPPSTSFASIERDEIVGARRPAGARRARISDCGELRPVDEHDPRPACGAIGALKVLGPAVGGRRAPVAEAALEQRHDLGERGVADDEDLRVVGPEPGVVEGDEVVAGDQLRDRCGSPRAGERNAIGMVVAVEQRRQRAQRDARRLLASRWRSPASCWPRSRSTSAGAKAGLRTMSASRSSEARGWARAPTDRRSSGPCSARPMIGARAAPAPRRSATELVSVGALVEQPSISDCSAERGLRVGGIAGVERRPRPAPPAPRSRRANSDLDAVRQRGMLDGREIEVGDLPDRRQMRAVDAGRCVRRRGATAGRRASALGAPCRRLPARVAARASILHRLALAGLDVSA